MSATLVADALVERLRAWDIHRIFGYSGDGIDPILAALRRAGGDPELVTARHEEGAALMATAHAKWTGAIGCCLATHGPGAIHLLNGLYDAKLDKRPVVALIAQQHRSALGSTYQSAGDRRSHAVQGRLLHLPADGDRAGAAAPGGRQGGAHGARHPPAD